MIFLDINMPAINGWDFMREFNMLDEVGISKTHVFILTSSSNPSEIEEARGYENVHG